MRLAHRTAGAADVPAGPESGRRRRRTSAAPTAGLLSFPVSWQILFFVVPVGLVAAYSVGALSFIPGQEHLTLESWRYFFGSFYLGLFWKSIRMSLIVSIAAVALAYPIAYFLALADLRRRYAWLLLIIAPAWTSYVLRVFAWKVVLGEKGIINSFVLWIGLRGPDHPIQWLIYSEFAVILVLTNVWVPFVALPIFVSIEGADKALLEAAGDLGASRWKSFLRVTFPLSLPGVFAAFLFVFIPTIGEFVTPLFVGGTGGFMYGNAITDLFGPGFDWQLGSVLAMFLLIVVISLMALLSRFLNVQKMAAVG